jgi:hypothetical protein
MFLMPKTFLRLMGVGVQKARDVVWEVVRYHLLFFLPVDLPELDSGTPEHQGLEDEFAMVQRNIAACKDDALDYTITGLKEELSRAITDISDVRTRGGQLLTVTGFIALLGTVGSSLPIGKAAQVLTYVLAGLALYALVGTLYLTSQVLRVREWEGTIVKPTSGTARSLKESNALQLYRICTRLALKLQRPARRRRGCPSSCGRGGRCLCCR